MPSGPSRNTRAMECERVRIPSDVTRRPGIRGPRFVVEETERRLRRESEERQAKWDARYLRDRIPEMESELVVELKKADGLVGLIQSILRDLAIRENLCKEISSRQDEETERSKRILERARSEFLGALRTVI